MSTDNMESFHRGNPLIQPLNLRIYHCQPQQNEISFHIYIILYRQKHFSAILSRYTSLLSDNQGFMYDAALSTNTALAIHTVCLTHVTSQNMAPRQPARWLRGQNIHMETFCQGYISDFVMVLTVGFHITLQFIDDFSHFKTFSCLL